MSHRENPGFNEDHTRCQVKCTCGHFCCDHEDEDGQCEYADVHRSCTCQQFTIMEEEGGKFGYHKLDCVLGLMDLPRTAFSDCCQFELIDAEVIQLDQEHKKRNKVLHQTVRPSFEQIYLQLAFQLANRSTCYRLKVGTVITSTDFRKVLAVGYNGNATGLNNGCDREEPGNCGCLHSEENAIINCDVPRGTEKIVFVTHLPCAQCAKRLINLGNVVKVYYGQDYRDHKSLELFKLSNIKTEFLNGLG